MNETFILFWRQKFINKLLIKINYIFEETKQISETIIHLIELPLILL